MGTEAAPQPEEATPRRALFTRRSNEPAPITSLERMVDLRLEEGLKAIEEQAAGLMKEIASELWRTSAADISDERSKILGVLSRDQALKSLITTNDERFQALAVRTARLEDSLSDLAESSRAIRDAMSEGSKLIQDVARSPAIHGVETIRGQLEQVEHHIAAAFQHLDDRDAELIGGIQIQVREHGELIARETGRIVQALEGYVQGGVDAIGQLAQRVEGHAQAFALHDENLAVRVQTAIEAEVARAFTEQIELLSERLGIARRDLQALENRTQELIETRVRSLAELIRSDSEALGRAIVQIGERQDAAAAEPPEAQAEQIVRTGSAEMNGLVDRIRDQVAGTVRDELSTLASSNAAALERQLDMLADEVETRVATALTADGAGGGAVEDVSSALEDRLERYVDERMTALAKMIRSDNRVLLERMSAAPAVEGPDVEGVKQVVRSVKELEASMAGDLMGGIDRRFQTMADQLHRESQSNIETMAKVAEVLSEKMDRVTVRVDERIGDQMQMMVGRMVSAIRSLGTGSIDIDLD
jgi:hypothetical protein